MGDTPVPIPNTMVKTQAADGTALETVWESRWPPDQKRKNSPKGLLYITIMSERTLYIRTTPEQGFIYKNR